MSDTYQVLEDVVDGRDDGVEDIRQGRRGLNLKTQESPTWKELKALATLSLPVAAATLARLFIVSTDTAFVGHIGKKELSAASFAEAFTSLLSNIAFAPGYSLNALCSQAIGAKNFKLAGVWLQLALFTTTLVAIPILAMYLLTEPVINLMVKDEGVPEKAQTYNYVSMLCLLPALYYMNIRQYFQAIQIVKPAMVVSIITVFFNIGMNFIFVPTPGVLELGLVGSPLATFVSMLFQLGCFLSFCVFYKGWHRPYWGGWSWSFLERKRVERFFKMVIPMVVGGLLENVGMQVIFFSMGHLGEKYIAGDAIMETVWGLMWSLYWGAGLALQVRVGHHLGNGDANGVRLVVKVALVIVVAICFVTGLGIYIFRRAVGQVFASSDTDSDVIDVVDDSMHAMVLNFFFSCMQLCAANILEATSQTKVMAIVLTIGMWCISVPCAILFAYKVPYFEDTPIAGVWIGAALGQIFNMVCLWGYLLSMDWEQMCLEAKNRSEMATTESLVDEEAARDDEQLERLLEHEDRNYDRSMPIPSSPSAEAIMSAHQAESPSPFIGSKSPKFFRNID